MPLPDLGQHLLCDPRVVDRVIEAAALKPGDHVLDAGAGDGALTRPIAAAVAPGGKVWAVDVDPTMVDALMQGPLPGVTVVESDLVEWPLPATLTAVVANPPFKIAAPIIERVAAAGVPRAVYVVPRELADRLSAKPGTKHYGKLSIRVGLRANVEDLGHVPRKAFMPPPGVTCGIIRVRARSDVPDYDAAMLGTVLDTAWAAWDRKARSAFGPLPRALRTDAGALTRFLVDAGWADEKVSTLPPDAFAAVAGHLAAGQKK